MTDHAKTPIQVEHLIPEEGVHRSKWKVSHTETMSFEKFLALPIETLATVRRKQEE